MAAFRTNGGETSDGAAKEVKKLVARGLAAGPAELAAVEARLEACVPAKMPFDEFRTLLADALRPAKKDLKPDQETTIRPSEFLTPAELSHLGAEAREPYTYMLVLPDQYEPTRAYPLVVGMHGAMGDPNGDYLWMRWCVKKGKAKGSAIMIVSRGSAGGAHSVAGIMAAVRKTLRETSAHRRAILLVCFSASGRPNAELLRTFPGVFAANYIHASTLPPNPVLARLPAYLSCGDADGGFFRTMSQSAKALKPLHRDLTWDVMKGVGHTFDTDYFADNVFPWFQERIPDLRPFAKEFAIKRASPFAEGISFVRFQPGKAFGLQGKAEGNALQLATTPKVALSKLRVYLPSDAFDHSKEVVISVNGKESRIQPTPPSASVALESAAYYRDATKIVGHAWSPGP
jgi:hypothetical protein